MGELMKCVALTAVLGCFLPTTVTTTGDWGEVERCPKGELVTGFSLKTTKEGDGALSSISLKCAGGSWIYSAQGPSGEWGRNSLCPVPGVITSCMLRFRGDEIDVAINNVDCFCDLYLQMLGDGLSKGSWQAPVTNCREGVTGIQTRVQKQIAGDNSALTGARFVCD